MVEAIPVLFHCHLQAGVLGGQWCFLDVWAGVIVDVAVLLGLHSDINQWLEGHAVLYTKGGGRIRACFDILFDCKITIEINGERGLKTAGEGKQGSFVKGRNSDSLCST